LLRLEDFWATALVDRDFKVFDHLLAPDSYTPENDQLMDRAAVIRSVVAGSDTVTAAHNEGMQVHRYGSVTAVVTGWLIVRGRNASGAFERRYRSPTRGQARWTLADRRRAGLRRVMKLVEGPERA